MDKVLLSSKMMDWQTPLHVLDLVRQVNTIALDPCTTNKNPTQARRYMAPDSTLDPSWGKLAMGETELQQRPFGNVGTDGLAEPWNLWSNKHGLVFVNPPYGRAVPKWVDKAILEAKEGAEIIMLLAARPDTKYFSRLADKADAIAFWRGRLQFVDPATGQPALIYSKKHQKLMPMKAAFPSMLVYFGSNAELFGKVFDPYTTVFDL